MNKLFLSCICILPFAGGCVSPIKTADLPKAKTPDQVVADQSMTYGDTVRLTKANMPDMQRWWQLFKDPVLNQLIERAAEQNFTLEQAYLNIEIAQQRYISQYGTRVMHLDGEGGFARTSSSENGPSGFGSAFNDFKLGLRASWEIDVFGALRHETKSAYYQILASREAYQFAWVSLAGEIARTYINLRTLQARLMVAQENCKVQSDTYTLLKSRYDEGVGDALAMYQAEYSMQSTRSTIPAIEHQIEAAQNALAVLIGATPGTLPTGYTYIKEIPQATALDLATHGIPAQLLSRRPDILLAERQFQAAVAKRQGADANRKPRFFINGTLGLDSVKSSDLLKSSSKYYSIGPSFTVPFLNGGQISANIKIAAAQEMQAFAAYQQAIITAVGDVKTAAYAATRETERLQSLHLAVVAAKNAYDAAKNKYDNGLTDFNNVLDAQRSLLAYQEQHVVSKGTIAQAYVALYQALCGSFPSRQKFILNPPSRIQAK